MQLTGLWLHSEFRKLWGGQASSLFATQFLYLALPLTAVSVLDATPLEMGIVTAMAGLPAVFGLPMGSWIDRRKRLPVIVAADIGRALLLAVIPVAHLLDVLTIELVYVVAFGIGTMSILFQIAYRSLLPSIVGKDQLVEANSKLEFATSGADSVGPAVVGFLAQALTAPFALFFGSGLYGLSGVLFRRIKAKEEIAQANDEDGSSGGIREGWRFFRQQRVLLGIGSGQAMAVLFSSAFEAVNILYMVRVLGLSEGTIGLIFAIGSIGLFIGTGISSRYSSRIGIGRITTIGIAIIGIGDLALPLAEGTTIVIAITVIAGGLLTEAGFVMYNIGSVSIKQAITPDALQGRVTSILVVSSRAAVPIGALVGGAMGELIGLRETLFITAFGMIASVLWMLYFRVWSVRSLDEAAA